MNLAIEFRSRNLDEIVGHEKTVKELKKRSKDFDFPNVMLFSGQTGTGKTTFEIILAKNILCLNKDENGNCCNQCETCNSINNETANNYYYVFNASNLGIDDMRNIENIAISKTLSKTKYKVIVIDELQELSSNKKAAKNILKLLEMPLKNTYFILGTMDEYRVDKSILNRSVKYRLNNLNEKQIGLCLISICKKKDIKIEDMNKLEVISSIASNSNGSMRTAIAYLERVIYSEIWNKEELISELGIVSEDRINLMINDLLSGNIDVLKNKITTDIIEKINNVLLLYYKVKSGYVLEQWQSSTLQDIRNYPIQNVQYAISRLAELLKYFYINQYLIDFAIIDIINNNKQPEKKEMKKEMTKSEDTVRRRRVVE